jgi:hypothetical protein
MRTELRIDHNTTSPHLRFKRGTKPFVVHYMQMENALIADAEWARKIGPHDLVNVEEVTAEFPKVSCLYLFANLSHYETFKTDVVYPKSRFLSGRTDYWDIHRTRIGRGEEPFDTMPDVSFHNLQFTDLDDYLETQKSNRLWRIIPRVLCLSTDRLPSIFNLSTNLTLFHEDLALPLRTAKNPGLWFPGPPVRVELG